jgi:hypothetical protein
MKKRMQGKEEGEKKGKMNEGKKGKKETRLK